MEQCWVLGQRMCRADCEYLSGRDVFCGVVWVGRICVGRKTATDYFGNLMRHVSQASQLRWWDRCNEMRIVDMLVGEQLPRIC